MIRKTSISFILIVWAWYLCIGLHCKRSGFFAGDNASAVNYECYCVEHYDLYYPYDRGALKLKSAGLKYTKALISCSGFNGSSINKQKTNK
jgi:hypothetical protein